MPKKIDSKQKVGLKPKIDLKNAADLKKKLAKYYEPITKVSSVRSIILYGSTIKAGICKGHDIDVLVFFDDSKENPEQEFKKIELLSRILTVAAAKDAQIMLHFQAPRPLSAVWEQVKKGEPWIICALRESTTLYDPENFVELLKTLIKEKKIYSVNEKAERLLARATEKFYSIREEVTNTIPAEFLKMATEITQAILSYYGIFTTSAVQTKDELEKLQAELGIDRNYIQFYDQLITMNEKLRRGTLSEFTCSEIDFWTEKLRQFIAGSEVLLIKCESKEKEKNITDSYKHAIVICEQALKLKKNLVIPVEDKDKISLFKKEFVDTGYLGEDCYDALNDLYLYFNKEKKEPIEAKYMDKVYLKGFALAIDELARKMHGEGVTEPMLQQPKQEVKQEVIAQSIVDFSKNLVKTHGETIKAIWAIPMPKKEKESIIVILIDDLKVKDPKVIKDMELCFLKQAETFLDKGVIIRPDIFKVTDYFAEIMQDKINLMAEIHGAIILHDPAGFIKPLKLLVSKGYIKGTKEFLFKLILSVKQRMKEITSTKTKVLSMLYEAIIDAAQAPVMASGYATLHPKELPDTLKTLFVKKEMLSVKSINDFVKVKQAYKDFEHDVIKDISGKELEVLIRKADTFIDRMKDLTLEIFKSKPSSYFI